MRNRSPRQADESSPAVPEPDADGNYPALQYARVSLALKIIRDRRKLRLTRDELARLAGVRPDTLNRIEQGTHSPSRRTIEKIDQALQRAESQGRR